MRIKSLGDGQLMVNTKYTAKSAYEAQFKGSYCSFRPNALWQARAEGKHKFFAWLLVQEKLLTGDKLIARNWHCNQTCPLCHLQSETAEHLCLHCPFAMQVWGLVRTWTDGVISIPLQGVSIEDCWCDTLAQHSKHSKQEQQHVAAILMYTAWNIWKERNRRIFEGESCWARTCAASHQGRSAAAIQGLVPPLYLSFSC